MVRILIAADGSDSAVDIASSARALFGDQAEYTVVNVADEGGLAWGNDQLAWGVSYPLLVPPLGGVTGAPPLLLQQSRGATYPMPDGVESVGEEPLDTPVDAAARVASDVATTAHLPNSTTVGEVGDAAEAILATVERVAADVVVVGAHDRGWLARMLSTSVSSNVLRDSPVPVLVVPDKALV